MTRTFSVASLDACRECAKPIDRQANPRARSYCSPACRKAWTQKAQNEARSASGYGREYQRARSASKATESADKKKCGACGLWFRRVGHHIRQRHGMTAREYRLEMGLPVSRGILAEPAREHLRALAIENGMGERLKLSGAGTRYAKGDPRAKRSYPLAGKRTEESDYF